MSETGFSGPGISFERRLLACYPDSQAPLLSAFSWTFECVYTTTEEFSAESVPGHLEQFRAIVESEEREATWDFSQPISLMIRRHCFGEHLALSTVAGFSGSDLCEYSVSIVGDGLSRRRSLKVLFKASSRQRRPAPEQCSHKRHSHSEERQGCASEQCSHKSHSHSEERQHQAVHQALNSTGSSFSIIRAVLTQEPLALGRQAHQASTPQFQLQHHPAGLTQESLVLGKAS